MVLFTCDPEFVTEIRDELDIPNSIRNIKCMVYIDQKSIVRYDIYVAKERMKDGIRVTRNLNSIYDDVHNFYL